MSIEQAMIDRDDFSIIQLKYMMRGVRVCDVSTVVLHLARKFVDSHGTLITV